MSKPVVIHKVSALLEQYFTQFPIMTVDELHHSSWGGDRDAFLANGETVFCFPRSQAAARSLGVELSFLPRLASCLPVSIPSFHYAAHDPDGLLVCAGYPLPKGEPLTLCTFRSLAVDDRRLDVVARQLGSFLTALHSFPVEEARRCGIPESPHPLIEQIVRQNAAVRASVYPHLDNRERDFLNKVFKGLLWEMRDYDPAPALCHGDLSGDHLLLSPGGENLAGVIDWGDMTLGDPSGDFAWRSEYGDDFFRRVLSHYHCPLPEPEQFDRVITYRCQLLPTKQMMWALQTGDSACFEQGRERIAIERERLPTAP